MTVPSAAASPRASSPSVPTSRPPPARPCTLPISKSTRSSRPRRADAAARRARCRRRSWLGRLKLSERGALTPCSSTDRGCGGGAMDSAQAHHHTRWAPLAKAQSLNHRDRGAPSPSAPPSSSRTSSRTPASWRRQASADERGMEKEGAAAAAWWQIGSARHSTRTVSIVATHRDHAPPRLEGTPR